MKNYLKTLSIKDKILLIGTLIILLIIGGILIYESNNPAVPRLDEVIEPAELHEASDGIPPKDIDNQ